VEIKPADRIIAAMDFQNAEPVYALAKVLKGKVGALKVGLELYTAYGPVLIERLQGEGYNIFLDLKFNDIPNTVAGAVRSAAKLGVWMTTIHASAGGNALHAASVAAKEAKNPLLIMGVTLLTSIDITSWAEMFPKRLLQPFYNKNEQIDVYLKSIYEEYISNMANLCIKYGMNGIVCSPLETAALRRNLGREVIIVTPGIRLPDSEIGDQKRFTTPEEAIRAGADYLVIGRPITRSVDPIKAVEEISKRMEGI